MRVSSLAGWLVAPLAALSVGCFVVAVRSAGDRRRAVEVAGLGLVATGVAHFAILTAGLNVAASVGETDGDRTALRAVYWSATSLLNIQAKVFLTIGTVLAIAAAYAGTGEIRSRLGTLRDNIGRRLQRPGWRAAASLAAIALGFFAMRWPEATTSIAIRTAAFLGFVAGAIGLLDVLGSVNWAHEGLVPFQRTARRFAIGATGAIAAVTVTLLFGGLAFARALRAPSTDQPDISETGCNGSHELCDRTLAEVVLRRHAQRDGRQRRRILRGAPNRQRRDPARLWSPAPSCSTSTTESTERRSSAPTSAVGETRRRRVSSTPSTVP